MRILTEIPFIPFSSAPFLNPMTNDMSQKNTDMRGNKQTTTDQLSCRIWLHPTASYGALDMTSKKSNNK